MLQEVNSMERKLNEIYGKIADALNDVIPENWIEFTCMLN